MSIPTIGVALVKAFAESTLQTLKIQCSFEARAGKPFAQGKGTPLDCTIAGVIGLTSTSFRGNISLCFPEATYLKIMGGMLGETYTEINSDLEDGASELLNIIFGSVKTKMNDQGHDIACAIPSVVRGEKIRITQKSKGECIVIPFESKDGAFEMQLTVE